MHELCALPLVMVLNRSWPAVSHICSFTSLLSTIIFLILKSMLQQEGRGGVQWCVVAMHQDGHGTSLRLLLLRHAPNGGDEAGREGVLGEAQQQAALAHA